jgi:hypothetical protein
MFSPVKNRFDWQFKKRVRNDLKAEFEPFSPKFA